MAGELVYAFRIMRLPLLDAGGAVIGRLDDIVIIPAPRGVHKAAPRVLGFVATSQRRRIFVNAGRIHTLDNEGARLRSWDVDLNPFKPRPGEVLVGRDLIDKRFGDETVSDIALRAVTDGRQTWWEPAKVRMARRSALRRRPSYRLLDIDELPAVTSPAEAAKPGATVLLNAPFPAERVWEHLPAPVQRLIVEKGLVVWSIDAFAVAKEVGMGSRINTVMQPCFFALSGVLPADEAIARIKENVEKTYAKRGQAVVERNFAAIDASLARLGRVPVGPVAGHELPPIVPADAPEFVRRVTAALMAGLDLVIAVDTSIAHLAAAIGRPVWLLLPYAPDWRWLLERNDSPWYPSARLFRQPASRTWEATIVEVRAELIRHFELA